MLSTLSVLVMLAAEAAALVLSTTPLWILAAQGEAVFLLALQGTPNMHIAHEHWSDISEAEYLTSLQSISSRDIFVTFIGSNTGFFVFSDETGLLRRLNSLLGTDDFSFPILLLDISAIFTLDLVGDFWASSGLFIIG